MNKILLLLALLATSACQFSPCGINKTSFLSKHEYLVDQAKEHRKDWSESDWEESDAKMKSFLEDCYDEYEADLTNKESSRFWSKTASYYVSRFGKSFLREWKRGESEVARSLEKGFESIKEDPDEFIRQLLNENGGEELKDALNDLGEGIKELGEELDSWLNE